MDVYGFAEFQRPDHPCMAKIGDSTMGNFLNARRASYRAL